MKVTHKEDNIAGELISTLKLTLISHIASVFFEEVIRMQLILTNFYYVA